MGFGLSIEFQLVVVGAFGFPTTTDLQHLLIFLGLSFLYLLCRTHVVLEVANCVLPCLQTFGEKFRGLRSQLASQLLPLTQS